MKRKFIYPVFVMFLIFFLVGCSKTTTEELTTSMSTTTSVTTQATTIQDTTYQPTTIPVTETPTTVLNYFTVTFMQDDIILKQETVLQGTSATPPTNTNKPNTNENFYQFNGWDKDFSNVQGDLVVNAIYIEGIILYEVNFYDYDGTTIIERVLVRYGYPATPPADIPVRTDEIYTYTFYTWIGDYSNITGNTDIYSSYIRTYTTTGNYDHSHFYSLVSTTFDIQDSTNIENNIIYLTEIFEAESEEEAYQIFNIIVFNYNQLTEFSDFQEFKDIFANLESGFLTDEKLVDILFNYFMYSNSYFIGLSDLELSWYNEVELNYNDFLDQYNLILDEQNQIDYDLNQAILLLDETLRTDAYDYFYAKTTLYSTEKAKFNYFNYLKGYIGNSIYDLNTAIWNILDEANIDPLLYNFYVNQYNSICNTYPLYLDKIETFRDIMTAYYNANQTYLTLSDIITTNPDYEAFITTSSSLYSSFTQSLNDYFLIKDDLDYWTLQMNGINAQMEYLDTIREIFINTENQELYKEALLIIIDDIQNMVLNANDIDFEELSNLVSYIVNNQDMYGFLDTITLFETITSNGLFSIIQGISDILDLRYQTITPEEWTLLDDALYNFSFDYANTLEEYDIDFIQEFNDTYLKASDYFFYFDILVTEIHTFIDSITIDEIEKFEVLVVNQEIYTQNEYTIELAKLIYDIYYDFNIDTSLFVNSYIYLNYFQVDVNVDFNQIMIIAYSTLVRMEEFFLDSEYISNTDPNEILESTLIQFYEDFNNWYHNFLFSYNFYLFQD